MQLGASPGTQACLNKTSPFKRILTTAVFAGVLAGLALTVVQKIQVSPILQQAEVFEDAARVAAASHASAMPTDAHEPQHEHSAAEAHEHEHEHHHAADAWQPADGVERSLYTALANVTIAIGYGLLLCAGLCLRGDGHAAGWRAGLLWGLGAYLTFFVAPSLGLPPEVPGTAAAPLVARQIWWLATAAMTAGGLSLLAFPRNTMLKLLGGLVLIAPHLISAPEPLVPASAAPAELARAFIHATAIANGVFWLLLGGLCGWFYKKFAAPSK